jgi:hypothetical protein
VDVEAISFPAGPVEEILMGIIDGWGGEVFYARQVRGNGEEGMGFPGLLVGSVDIGMAGGAYGIAYVGWGGGGLFRGGFLAGEVQG